MALQQSGFIELTDIHAEFGGVNPIGTSETEVGTLKFEVSAYAEEGGIQ